MIKKMKYPGYFLIVWDFIRYARELGIPVREDPFAERDIPRVAEVFLAGTTTDVMPIVWVNGQVIGNGVPGPITTRLIAAFRAYLDASCPARYIPGSVPTPA